MFVKPKPKIKLKNTQNKIYFALIEVKIYTRFFSKLQNKL